MYLEDEIMKKRKIISFSLLSTLLMCQIFGYTSTVQAADSLQAPVNLKAPILADVSSGELDKTAPFTTKTDLYDQTKSENLGLTAPEGAETVTVFSPSDSTDHYSNGIVMTAFKGLLYCQWQSSAKDEDANDTWVAYSRSKDGKTWSDPMKIVTPDNLPIANAKCSNAGWWVAGDTLVAYVNVWPQDLKIRGGLTYYTTSTDGLTWTELKPVKMADGNDMNGIFEQDPHALPDGRIINAVHFQPGLFVAPVYTDDPSGVQGWKRASFTNLPTKDGAANSQEMEPSWYMRSDGAIVMVFRDQGGSYKRLASISYDRGENWSTAVVTDSPDSRAKQSAGNLPDGTAFMVNNPVSTKVVKTRSPLVITLSKDGRVFDTAYAIRQGGSDLPTLLYTGKAKTLGYSYPKSMLWQDYLYVAYSTNKEYVEFTRIPVSSLSLNSTIKDTPTPDPAKLACKLVDISGHWAAADINKLVTSGAITGYSNGSFKPDQNITRAEFVKILVKALKLETKSGKLFTDTENHWAMDYISTAYTSGIISGYNDTTFGPDDFITREQVAVMIVKAAKLAEVSEDTSFTDNSAITNWARSSVAVAKKNGIIKGYSDNSFRPLDKATKAEAVTMVVKAMLLVK